MLWDEWISPYSAISQPFSGLGLGVTGPYMNAAFVIAGLLVVFGAFGVFGSIDGITGRARIATITLFALHGVGLILDGLFTLESFLLHFIGFLLALSLIPGFLVAGLGLHRVPGWRGLGKWLIVASPVTVVLTVIYFATFDPVAAGQGMGIAGLTERIFVIHMHLWVGVLAWRAFRQAGGSNHISARAPRL